MTPFMSKQSHCRDSFSPPDASWQPAALDRSSVNLASLMIK